MIQLSTAGRTAMGQVLADRIASGSLLLFAENVPVNNAASDPATVVASGSLPATAATVSSGVVSKSGTWSMTGQAGAGGGTTVKSFRIKGSGAVVEDQGSVTISGGLTASCNLTAGNATITAPANAIPNGCAVSGTGVQAGTYVASGGGTTSIVLNQAPLVSGTGVTLTFTGDMTLDNPNIATGQAGAVSTYSRTMPGA